MNRFFYLLRHAGRALVGGVGLWLAVTSLLAGNGALEIHNGYFWDPAKADYFIPRGIAYQCWNPPVGANQSFDQIDYDLIEFKKMYANSVRCEFVWGEVQTGTNTWDWSKPDHLVAKAEELGLKLFVIIGFQYPPKWFPPEWRSINEEGLTTDVLNCLGSNRGGDPTNCLPKTIMDALTTNLPPEVVSSALRCVTSNEPSEIIGCLKANIPEEHQRTVLAAFVSDVINYERPEAREAYTRHIAEVAKRYQHSKAIGGWIMGNETAYFDLWESPDVFKVHRFIGYDSHSLAAFQAYLRQTYGNNITALNFNWRTSFADFNAVIMPRKFPAARDNPAFHDLIQWRQQSIANWIALGAAAARTSDPNHLITYSMVGGIFNGADANNTCEDAVAIVKACRETGAPLDYWSINNYAWAFFGNELRTGDFGVTKYQELVGLPVMLSETGHSSTEDKFKGAQPRQAKALPGTVWEALISGAIGVHIFHWSDRDQFSQGYFDREKGFGIVHQNRRVKDPVYFNVLEMFRRMEDIRIERLLGNSKNPPHDLLFYWSKASDIGFPRANQENAMFWGALKRLGFEPGLIDDAGFRSRHYTNASALILSRSFQLEPQDLDRVANEVIPAGIHVHANADLPGQVDTYLRPNPNWSARMNQLFGLDVSNAVNAFEGGATNDNTTTFEIKGAGTLGPINPNWNANFVTWKIWHGLRATAGTTLVTDTGFNQSQPPIPALHLRSLATAKTAIDTFGLADTFAWKTSEAELWSVRYDLLHAIYRGHFGLKPTIDISGPGAKHVIPDYRLCRNGSVLVSILNEHTSPANVRLSAPSLLAGKTIENISTGGIVEVNSDGIINLSLSDDEYVLLYAYNRRNDGDESLLNPNPAKIWFKSAPLQVRPRTEPYPVEVGYDISDVDAQLTVTYERVRAAGNRVYSSSLSALAKGQGSSSLLVPVPDPDLNDPEYISSLEGGEYGFHAVLHGNGVALSETFLPVRLAWGVRPVGPLPEITPGRNVQVPVEWQELSSYDDPGNPMPLPLDRPALWESVSAKQQHYNVVLNLLGGAGQVVASTTNITANGTGRQIFDLAVPQTASGPFSWSATLQSAPATGSQDVCDSFEGRDRGSDLAPFTPWFSYSYPIPQNAAILAQGVLKEGTENSFNRFAYLIVTNPPMPAVVSGFGLVIATNEWKLPTQRARWADFVFSFDFKEKDLQPCTLELQVKDANGNWIQFTKPYQPRADGWDTIRANLAEFTVPVERPGFDPNHVFGWALNIRMTKTDTVYEGYFDNVHFVGPPSVGDDFENRTVAAAYSRIAPWGSYGYDEPNHDDVKLNVGVQLEGSDGSQSVFLVARNKTNSGAYAGFGLFYSFEREWSLPANPSDWRNYSFSFDFREEARPRRDCVLELQLKNKNTTNESGVITQYGLHFTKPYTPGPNGWDTITATLDQFIQHPGFQPFDPAKVDSLVVNIAMTEKSATEDILYVGSFDNIRFNGPEVLAPGETIWSIYSNANDFFGIRSIAINERREAVISWTGGGVMQTAENVTGPWKDADSNANPLVVPLATELQFYRVRR